MTRSSPLDPTLGLINATLIAIPLWGALWLGAAYAIGKFMASGGAL